MSGSLTSLPLTLQSGPVVCVDSIRRQLAALYSYIVTVEREQTDIERTLEQQQRDLSVTLDAYEQSTEEILGIQGGSLRSLDTNVTKSEHPP